MSEPAVEKIFGSYKTWAVVGCSPDPFRDSHSVARFLQTLGLRVIPVNPGHDSILGERCYPDLSSVPETEGVEVVDIFRRPEYVSDIVDEAIATGAKAVWMQLGVIDAGAADRARLAGLDVVMDRCPKVEYPRLPPR